MKNRFNSYGQKQGYWEEDDDEGKWVGYYKNDVEHGIWVFYSNDKENTIVVYGDMLKTKVLFNLGKVEWITSHSTCEIFYKNRNIIIHREEY